MANFIPPVSGASLGSYFLCKKFEAHTNYCNHVTLNFKHIFLCNLLKILICKTILLIFNRFTVWYYLVHLILFFRIFWEDQTRPEMFHCRLKQSRAPGQSLPISKSLTESKSHRCLANTCHRMTKYHVQFIKMFLTSLV